MADFRTHMTVSTTLGVAYGVAATKFLGFPHDAGILAGGLTAVGGMLPDLDSGPGRPARELSGLAAAVIPMLLLPRFEAAETSTEAILVTMGSLYLLIRYGVPAILKRVSVHRGMFHSIPAMLIAGLLVYTEYGSPNHGLRLLLAVGVMLGFLSHLVLDEIYSVDLSGFVPKLNQFAGSAVKFFSASPVANGVCYGILISLIATAYWDYQDNPNIDWGPLAKWLAPATAH
jgi:membrane-bound metal-dependent hydrolase YbcI (DUF457 family)